MPGNGEIDRNESEQGNRIAVNAGLHFRQTNSFTDTFHGEEKAGMCDSWTLRNQEFQPIDDMLWVDLENHPDIFAASVQ